MPIQESILNIILIYCNTTKLKCLQYFGFIYNIHKTLYQTNTDLYCKSKFLSINKSLQLFINIINLKLIC